MNVRFLPDGRMKTVTGSMLEGGAPMTSEDAVRALAAVTRVYLHSYPNTVDITGDHSRVQALLRGIEERPALEGHSARLYRGGSETILVIEHSH